MRRIRYLTMAVVCLIGCIAAWGQSDFNPASPSEPGAPVIKYALNLTVATGQGGSVSGAGSYTPGTNVTVKASPSTGYTFEAWADVDGNVLSTTANYVYTTKARKETLVAHFRFTPGSPTEPDTPSKTLYYRLDVQATTGGSVSGGGRYLAGKTINVYANTDTGFDFVNWTNEAGDVVSVSRSFNYTKKTENEVLTAHFRFNPSSPSEPDGIPTRKVKATCTDGGTWSGTTGRILEGNTGSLTAYANMGYEFTGWYLNDELYTNLRSFSYTVGKENMDFEARFRFNQASPSEPKMPAISTYSYYLMTINALPGTVISYPINLMNTQAVKDINIRLTFPEGMEVSPENFVLSDKAVGYEVTIAEAKDDISIIEEGAKLYDFTMIGGTTEPGTQALLTFQVKIPDTMPTGSQRQVKINQISMTMEDGTEVTAHTRNGRIGVYKLGDSNGDDAVNIIDKRNLVNRIVSKPVDEFIEEVSDVNGDGNIDISDARGIISIILTESQTDE